MATEAPSNVLPGRCPIEATSDPTDEPEDIDQGTMKLMVGLIAASLGAVCTLLAGKWLASISEAYIQGGWARDVFVGALFAIAAFLLSYLGGSKCEAWLSKIAAVAALGVALFPCNCKLCPAVDEAVRTAGAAVASCIEPPTMERVPGVHLASATVLFLVLTAFCRIFYLRAKRKCEQSPTQKPTKAGRRMVIYSICAVAILGAVAALGVGVIFDLGEEYRGFVFAGESAGLFAFGISWLTASKVVPWLADDGERLHPTLRGKRRTAIDSGAGSCVPKASPLRPQ